MARKDFFIGDDSTLTARRRKEPAEQAIMAAAPAASASMHGPYVGHCRTVRIGLFGSRYSEISTEPTLLKISAARSSGTVSLTDGNGRLLSAHRTETTKVHE
jgi:hypothetical protein